MDQMMEDAEAKHQVELVGSKSGNVLFYAPHLESRLKFGEFICERKADGNVLVKVIDSMNLSSQRCEFKAEKALCTAQIKHTDGVIEFITHGVVNGSHMAQPVSRGAGCGFGKAGMLVNRLV